MKRARRTLVASVCAVVFGATTLTGATTASAWTQESNDYYPGSNMNCSPCVFYPRNTQAVYKFGAGTNSSFYSFWHNAFSIWNTSAGYTFENPTWSYNQSASSSYYTATHGSHGTYCGVAVFYVVNNNQITPYPSWAATNDLKTYVSSWPVSNPSTQCYIQNVLLHEIGHSGQGVGHSQYSDVVMWHANNQYGSALRYDEINYLASVYNDI